MKFVDICNQYQNCYMHTCYTGDSGYPARCHLLIRSNDSHTHSHADGAASRAIWDSLCCSRTLRHLDCRCPGSNPLPPTFSITQFNVLVENFGHLLGCHRDMYHPPKLCPKLSILHDWQHALPHYKSLSVRARHTARSPRHWHKLHSPHNFNPTEHL